MELKEYFKQPYRDSRSFLENVVFPIFGEERFEDAYDEPLLDTNPELLPLARATGVAAIERVGRIYLGDVPIEIFDIRVESHVRLSRNRVGVQQLVRTIMATYSGAFMLFHYDGRAGWDWRFTFCNKGDGRTDTTDSKRYTFLLGPGQSCRTAAENFQKLLDKHGDIRPEDIQTAFDVEALSREFFEKYKLHYERFVEYITGKRFVKEGGKWKEKTLHEPHAQMYADFGRDDKRVRDYVKKLLGRIVFLHFLQKKGWLGVPRGGQWGEGDMQFMKHLFDHSSPRQRADYLDLVLEPLFARGIDTEREGGLYDTGVGLPYGSTVRIPYLNGGLFERDALDEIPTQFPEEFFAELLDFFYQYNFTIDENDPNDAQVGVDPEMLGRIFENLLEDNKDKGAFYTPKEIVQYMCRQSLTAYLQTGIKGEADRTAIDTFVHSHDVSALGGAASPLAQTIDRRLRDVKVCDPAIGSGAFPMGLLKELFLCRGAIEDFDNATDIKRHIIQQNIYGVDIERGAVDIARLRFWLSLVVDEETPEALPNLDYKIMQGNSLLEQYQTFDLSTVADSKYTADNGLTLFENITDVHRRQLRHLLTDYFTCADHDRRRTLRSQIADNVRQQLQETGCPVNFNGLDLAANTEFFLWHTWFYDVFANGGFDIVIGNPPYGAKLSKEEIKRCKETYKSAQTIKGRQKGSTDTYTLFIEQAYNIMRKNACFAMIVPISLTSSDSLSGVHRILLSNCDDVYVSSYAVRPQPVFENAVVNTSILTFRKTDQPCQHVYATKMYRKGRNFNLQHLVDHLKFVEVKDLMLFGRIPKISEDMEVRILNKLRRQHKVGEYIREEGAPIIYRFAGGRYFKVITNYSNGSSAERTIFFDKNIANSIGCILSSNLSFWFYQIYSDNLNWKGYELSEFRLPPLSDETIEQLEELYTEYLEDIERNANRRKTTEGSSYHVDTFKEYKIGRSKAIIDRIDDLICPLYGLTQEETEFIKNYEIEFRLSGDE